MCSVMATDEAVPPMRLHYLDGLRGWAALAVVIYHSTCELFGQYFPPVGGKYLLLLNDGRLAVYVFFVLSGLVLTHSYLRSQTIGKIQQMALARYPRLTIPIASASFIGFVLMRCHLMFNHQAIGVVGRADWLGLFYTKVPSFFAWARFSTYDVFFAHDIASSYDVFLWTMPAEMMGSFLLFGLAALSDRHGTARRFYYAVGVFLTWRLQPYLVPFIYGMIIAEVMQSEVYRRVSEGFIGNLAGLTLFVVACTFSVIDRYRSDAHELGVIACVTVLAACLSPALRNFFQNRVSLWLGHLSFPLYLMHSFVICSYSCYMILWLNEKAWVPSSIALFVVASTIILSLAAAQLFSPVERGAVVASHWFARRIM